jgi:UDP-N-acetylglucosamine--N-acetylmuramyl-(pentapeptide) pyrophosphoryl-undecaprenol N-acetylglucosamine transferase
VVGFGSYHAFPVLLAALLLRRKIILFEANCALGRVNRLFAPFAWRIALQFPLERPLKRSLLVSMLPWEKSEEFSMTKEEARRSFGLESDRTTLLIFGGSQGAAIFNECMPQVLFYLTAWCPDLPLQVIHLTGQGERPRYEGIPACVKEFEKTMHVAYAASDIAVCRSGAGTVAELLRYQLPALLVPFPHAAEGHQWKNGEFLAHRVGGAKLLKQSEATPLAMARMIQGLLLEKEMHMRALWAWRETQLATLDFPSIILAEMGKGECTSSGSAVSG